MFAINSSQYSQTIIIMYWKTLINFDPFDETTYSIQVHDEKIYLIFSWLFFLYLYTTFISAHNKLRNFNTVLDKENDELVHKNEGKYFT
jgi:hypothetical protein